MEATLALARAVVLGLAAVGLMARGGRGSGGDRLAALQVLVQTRLPDADHDRPNPYRHEPDTGSVRVLDPPPRRSTSRR